MVHMPFVLWHVYVSLATLRRWSTGAWMGPLIYPGIKAKESLDIWIFRFWYHGSRLGSVPLKVDLREGLTNWLMDVTATGLVVAGPWSKPQSTASSLDPPRHIQDPAAFSIAKDWQDISSIVVKAPMADYEINPASMCIFPLRSVWSSSAYVQGEIG